MGRFLLTFILFLSLKNSEVLSDTIIINDWWYLGPFPIGVREGITGIDLDIFDEEFQPDTTKDHFSFLVPSGVIKWKRIKTVDEHIVIKYENVEWNAIQEYYGVAGLACASILYSEFECNEKSIGFVSARSLGSFILNGKLYPGDPYHSDYVQIPVVLNKGKNKVVLRPAGYGEHSCSFKIITSPPPLMIIRKDITLPDFILEKNYSGYIGIPILNATERLIMSLKIEISGDGIKKTEKVIPKIVPLSVIKVPVPLETQYRIEGKDSTLIKVRVYNSSYEAEESVWAKIKRPDEPYVKTFISKIDNSCQYYGVLPPEDFNPESEYGLIMSCHGANVEAINQVRSYSKKEWAYVVAPTNRRRYGFDWQDWGELDFLEVLEDVKKKFKIDEDRIYLTGHSMGGHGVWHIGLSHPGLFAAIAPSAGWTSFQLYFPWFLQRSEMFAEPELIKLRDIVLRKDNTPVFLENALNLPIYILHGGADEVVPPLQGRMMAQYLKELGYEFMYNEVEGKGHWWDIDSTPGVDCVDLKEMMDFLRNRKRNPVPESIIFRTSNIAHSNKAYWIRIDELENIYQDGRIKAVIDSAMWIVSFPPLDSICAEYFISIITENISAFTVLPEDFKYIPEKFSFNVNGKRYRCKYQKEITFTKSAYGFRINGSKERRLKKTTKLYGPIKQAYFSPFILVYGTIGDSIDTENNLHQARLQSYNWWIRANGFCEIIPDTEITGVHIENFNLILFGNSQTNAIIKNINKSLPINFKCNNRAMHEDCIIVDNKILKKDDLCLMEVYPNPLNPHKFVLLYSATTKKAQKYLNLFPVIYSGSGLPDFIIWDENAVRYGWTGIILSGFFDKNWQIDKKMLYKKYSELLGY
ncbi:MAG: prolyl oligopeptidase family serine peptidase [candidate division WOR-3 bacterium]|nr:prolyl oligopeptidase family serine peptidase [candidate division WOR-3 bacterium]